MPTTNSYYTIIRNTSGQTRFFDFVGEHGAELANGADVKFPGNIFDKVAKDPKKVASLKYAIENGVCQIIQTPHVYGYDTGTGSVMRVGFTSGVTALNPDTGSYFGSAPS